MKKCLTLCLCLTALLCLIFITTPKASAATYSDLAYTVSNGKVTITDCDTYATGSLTIPATIEGYPVTTIGNYAFSSCTRLTSVTISDSVTTIGNYAFSDCDSLTSVTIPDSVTTIGNYAFDKCTGLTSITIPDSVTSIGYHAFSNCTSLTSITIPDSVTTIDFEAFRNCTSLTSITIPDSVTGIGSGAFAGCSNLESMTIPFVGGSRKTAADTYQYPFGYIFGTYSYTGGVSTRQYYYGSSTSSTTSTTYYIPEKLKSVTVTGGNILYGAFYKCTGLTSVAIGDSVTTIGDDAFYNCTGLTSVTIGNSVTTIGNHAFAYCTSLTGITIPDSVTTIGYSAFFDCTSLTDVYITDPNAWCKIRFGSYDANPLYYADNGHILDADGKELTELVLGTSVTSIPDYAFTKCNRLTGITIPDSVTTIGNSAFYECTSLTGITIPDSVTTIGRYAFGNCTSLTSVTIGDSVTTIGGRAFNNCTGLTGITIPDSVTTIGDWAFYECSKLKNVYYSGTEAQWKNITIGSNNSRLTNATKHYSHIHDYTLFPAETVAPTCTTGGYTIYTCVYGETMKSDIVPTLGHVPGSVTNKLDATCTQQGYTEYICSRCQAQFQAAYVDALGHDYSGPVVEAYHNCTEKGYSGASCTRCDAVRQDTVLPALGHNAILIAVCDPTCTEKGVSKAGTQCQRCKTYLLEPVWIPALGHSFTDYIPNNDATYFADGTKTATCTTCGEKDTVVDEGTRLIPEGNVILLQPENVNADSGATVSFSMEAFGQIVSYQWQYRKVYKWFDTSLEGFDTNALTVPATGARNGYDYRCVVTFADGTVLISEPAELTVNTTITVTKNPNNQTAVLGDKGQFTASAQGEGIKYQWQYCRPGSEKWMDTAMEGATKATVYIETTKSRDGYQYRCKITDVTGKVVYTEAATLRVMSITEHPADRFTAPGKTVTFSVTTNVTGGVTYQWQYRKSETANWTNTTMTGYNTATLSVAATLARNGYQYRCVITGSKNSKLESTPATLHAGNPAQFTAQPQDLTVIDTETAVLTVSATNAYTYCWQYRSNGNSWRNTSLTGYNTDTLTVPAMGKNGYQYRCIITGLDGNTYTSEAATLTVVETPILEVISDPSDRTVPAERTVRFAAFADGDVTGYCWQYTLDGQTWLDAQGEGTDTNILTVIATANLNGAQFRCVVTGLYGMQVITQSATLTVQ